MPDTPLTLRGAAVVQAVESLVVLAAAVLAGVDAASGQSYHVNSGIALTVIGVLAAAGLAWVALALARARRWSRTPALLTQLFVGIVGIYLLQSHRLDWGVVTVVLAVLGFAALLSPPSMRALTGGQQSAAGVQQAPAGGQQAATGRKQAPAGGQQAPAGGQQAATGGKQAPAGGKQAPTGGKQAQGKGPRGATRRR